MDKYLLQILHEINTIIIPGLGALTVTNSKTGEIMFMGFLKHDDGNLANYIAQKEGFSENEAKNLIAKYVREINAKLDAGDTYDMYQFGRFKKNNGDIEFENWDQYNQYETNSENILAEEPTESKEVIEPLEKIEKSVSDAVENVLSIDQALMEEAYSANFESENKALQEADNFIEDLLSASQLKEKPKKLDEILGNKEEAGTEKKTIEKVVPEIIRHEKETKVIDLQIKTTESEKSIKEKKKRSKFFWMMSSFLIFIAISTSLVIIFYEDIEEVLFAEEEFNSYQIENQVDQNSKKNVENAKNQVSLPKEESVKNEVKEQTSNVSEVNVNKNPIENESTQSTSNLTYHLISGAFGVKANAERQAKKFQNEGIDAIILGKFSGLYFVCYESFETKQEAIQALKSKSIKAWIFKYQR